jgi:hypothetical protein
MTIEIGKIVDAIEKEQIRVTNHALAEAAADSLSVSQLLNENAVAEIIEQYPADRPYPSCLILGDSEGPVHTVWAYNDANGWAVLITVYRPDPKRWVDWRVRRLKQ